MSRQFDIFFSTRSFLISALKTSIQMTRVDKNLPQSIGRALGCCAKLEEKPPDLFTTRDAHSNSRTKRSTATSPWTAWEHERRTFGFSSFGDEISRSVLQNSIHSARLVCVYRWQTDSSSTAAANSGRPTGGTCAIDCGFGSTAFRLAVCVEWRRKRNE